MVFASWRGFVSPLRHRAANGSCLWGGHEIWWELEAPSVDQALSHLPGYVADRTTAVRIADVDIP